MPEAYDQIAYPGNVFQDTHPDRSGTIAFLHGMGPAPTDACRVLELGAGNGGNMIPMAWAWPDSTFLGVDRAVTAVSAGTAMIRELGLTNARLEVMDLLEVPPDLGEFDYIIAHGVFSWVPDAVRRNILQICKRHLAPQGVAFISYLTMPGTHLRNVFRDAMLFHTRGISDPGERVQQARAMTQLIADAPGDDPYKLFARSLVSELVRAEDSVIFHDYLAEVNAPFYFIQFAEMAARHGLQFLSEAEYPAGFFDVAHAAEHVRQAVARFEGNMILREQYYDFMRCRRFRQTLLCHDSVALARPALADRVASLHVASQLKSRSATVDLRPGVIETFQSESAIDVHTDHPAGKAAFQRLGECWPHTLPVVQLLDEARRIANSTAPPEQDRAALLDILLRCYERGHAELWRSPPRFARVPPDRPELSPVARYQLAHDRAISTLKHMAMEITDDLAAELLRLLDGTRDRVAIARGLEAAVLSRRATLEADGRAITEPAEVRTTIEAQLEVKLQELASAALLVER